VKVAFGTTLLDRGLNNSSGNGIDGIGQYCQELIAQYQQISDAPSIVPFSFGHKFSPSHAQLFPSYSKYISKQIIGANSSTLFQDVDLIHSTDQFIPISKKPLIATVMDVIPLSHPHFIKSQSRYLKAFIWKKLSQRADRIITISEFSKQQIIQYLKFSEEQIDVIPLGVNPRYFQKIKLEEREKQLSALGINRPFFLFLGSIQPRKNIRRLIDAHEQLPRGLANIYPLVIAGKLAWDDGKILSSIKRGVLEGRVQQINYISEPAKQCLLQSATALAFVSLYEGFGLPIIEAFASELPVITSNCSSMPEIAKNAALTVDPFDTKQITEAFLSLIENGNLVNELKVAGLVRAKSYSWEENAKQTIEIYKMMG
jgi:glycosyltransferase involved in cell wall biosynthesis